MFSCGPILSWEAPRAALQQLDSQIGGDEESGDPEKGSNLNN
jgi:hypothetical protein